LSTAYTERMNASARRIAVLAALVLGSLGCCALVVVRVAYTGVPNFTYLIWNLFLAWIPFVLAILLYDGRRRGMGPFGLAALGVLWLLFFPNAPYIFTDFIHLERDPLSPLWFDGVTIASFAAVGLLLGFGSLYLVQSVVRRALGTRLAWAVAGGALALGSVGIYVGRFVRLNSWDFVTSPRYVLWLVARRLADPFGNPKLLAVVLASTLLLGAAYLVVYTVASAGLRLELDRS
jgi:uncharacterized membrane protein